MWAAYVSYAVRVDSSAEVWPTGTSHQPWPGGLGPYRSVSTWTTVVRVAAFAFSIAARNSSTEAACSTSAPSEEALAARSTGSTSPSSSPESPSRKRYLVPNRCEPSDSDSEPMEANPWFWTRTTMTFSPSETMVAIS